MRIVLSRRTPGNVASSCRSLLLSSCFELCALGGWAAVTCMAQAAHPRRLSLAITLQRCAVLKTGMT